MKKLLITAFVGMISILTFSFSPGMVMSAGATEEYPDYCNYGSYISECACSPRTNNEYLCEFTNGEVRPCTLDGEGQVAFECVDNTLPRNVEVYYDGTGAGDTVSVNWSAPACTHNVAPSTPCTTTNSYQVRAYTQDGTYVKTVISNGTSVDVSGLQGGEWYYFGVIEYDASWPYPTTSPVYSRNIFVG